MEWNSMTDNKKTATVAKRRKCLMKHRRGSKCQHDYSGQCPSPFDCSAR